MKKAIKEIIDRITSGERSLEKIKRDIAKKYSLKKMPRNTEIMKEFPRSKLTKEILELLRRKPMRTSSGVSPVAVMIRPEKSCPWSCIYCPYTGKAPKSYTGEEPAALRARESKFDPWTQVKTRLKQFKINGHPTDKCEIIIMGGTFLRTPDKYQRWFIKNIYDAMNGRKSKNLEQAKKFNEIAKNKIIGLTIETRPDVCGKKEIDKILEYGGTRVELGVQHPCNKIYKRIDRGHGTKEVIEATKLAKDSGLKVVYHLMPGLLGSNKRKDIGMIKKIFGKQEYRPDMLKIYPTLVIKGTGLYSLMEKGEYNALSSKEAVEILSEWYRTVPEYVRIMRIQRDIPSGLIDKGVKKSNLRELVEKRIIEKKIKSKEIRIREIGLNKGKIKNPKIRKIEYSASDGKELFISLVDGRYLIGFIRLRIPGKSHRKEIDSKSAIIRELHIYGEEEVIKGKKRGLVTTRRGSFNFKEVGEVENEVLWKLPPPGEGRIQHKGFGELLLKEAEKIAKKKFGKKKMVIISGVGVREYYYKFGYKKEGAYVCKRL